MGTYGWMLFIHHWMRWVVFVFLAISLFRSYRGWFWGLDWRPQDNRSTRMFMILVDVQLLLGLILYFFLSPFTAFQNFSVVMKTPDLRFFTVEHTSTMILMIVLAHVAFRISKSGKEPRYKFRTHSLLYTGILFLILVGTPWFRPLFRLAT